MGAMNAPPDPHRLREFVESYHVTWAAQPLTVMRDGSRIQVGHEVELRADHKAEAGHSSMECGNSNELYSLLQELAETALPCPDDSIRIEFVPWDGSLHLDPTRGLRPEVILRIHILHREDYFEPIDECENRCLKEIERRFEAFGVQHGHWHEHYG